MGHPVLRTRAQPIPQSDITSARIQRLIDDMFETMHEYSGIGLAAPQIHESLRLFVAGVRDPDDAESGHEDDDMPLMTVINPTITVVGDEVASGWEACLSIPDIRGMVPRAANIQLDAFDRRGKRVKMAVKGLAARVIQHETDHLDGVLFFDRMTTFESLTFVEEFKRYWTKNDE